MNHHAISAQNVTVEYFVPEYRFSGIKEYLMRKLKGRTGGKNLRAVDGVSLFVEQGESVALLGHNGSGKSTFLKVLAGIIRPANAHVQVKGRIAPMIELGTGFDGELSGYENIFLSCTLMGLSKAEITQKVDNIVQFAELEEFIHMPLKNYSSGMQARLGFACATAIDPDVLLIDEVLSVGDSNFSRKCLKRIDELRNRGTTVVLVSHDPNTVSSFCSRGFVFYEGKLMFSGPILEALAKQEELMLERYLDHLPPQEAQEERRRSRLKKNDSQSEAPLPTTLVEFCLVQNGLRNPEILELSEGFEIEFSVHVRDSQNLIGPVAVGFALQTQGGQRIFGTNNIAWGEPWLLPQGTTGPLNYKCKFRLSEGFRGLKVPRLVVVVGVHDSNLTRTCFISKMDEINCSNSAINDPNFDDDLLHAACSFESNEISV